MGYVYKITNTVNGKSYIGISINEPEKDRIQKHLSGCGNRIIASAVKKYGRDAFTYEILEASVFDEFLPDLEVAYIANFNTVAPNGYNLTHGGDGAGCLSTEARRKISEANKGRKHSIETRRKISEANKGKSRNFGRTHSVETRRKISEVNKGKKLSAEHRRKISEAKTGKTFSAEHRRRLSESHVGMKGKSHSVQTRRKMSELAKKRSHSAETRRKISQVQLLPENAPAHDFFRSLPSDMPLKEKRKLLYQAFPNVNKITIRYWVRKWNN